MATEEERIRIKVEAETQQAQRQLKQTSSATAGLGKQLSGLALPLLTGWLGMKAFASQSVQSAIAVHSQRESIWRLQNAMDELANVTIGRLFDALDKLGVFEGVTKNLEFFNTLLGEGNTTGDLMKITLENMGLSAEEVAEKMALIPPEVLETENIFEAFQVAIPLIMERWRSGIAKGVGDILGEFTTFGRQIRDALFGSEAGWDDELSAPIPAKAGLFSPILSAWGAVWNAIKTFDFNAIWTAVQAPLERVVGLIQGVWNGLTGAIGDVFGAIGTTIFERLRSFYNNTVRPAYNFLPDWAKPGSGDLPFWRAPLTQAQRNFLNNPPPFQGGHPNVDPALAGWPNYQPPGVTVRVQIGEREVRDIIAEAQKDAQEQGDAPYSPDRERAVEQGFIDPRSGNPNLDALRRALGGAAPTSPPVADFERDHWGF